MRELFENNGHLNDKGVSLFVDALRLDKVDALPAELTGHIEECTECKKAVVQLHAVMKDTAFEDGGEHPFLDKPSQSEKSSYYSGYRIAALVAFLAFIGVMVFYFVKSPYVPDIDPDAYAENFVPLPLYESMVEQDFRSYGLEIISPPVGAELTDAVIFKWEIQYDDPLIIMVLDNRAEVVHEMTVTGDEYYFDGLPEPGLYYWRLETEERLLYVGKFIVPVEHNF